MQSLVVLVVWGILHSTAAVEVNDEWGTELSAEIDCQWILSCGFLVVFMQAGFAMLEAGSISSKHVQNIMFKNLLDTSIGAIVFFFIGYGFAFGNSVGGFMGSSHFAMTGFDRDDYHMWFFQFAFASVAATIVSGAVAARCKLETYFVYSLFITGFVYPIIAHWVWTEGGWLTKLGMIDFAGSGVVHMTGGCVSLVAAVVIGPRIDRLVISTKNPHGKLKRMRPNNVVMQALGVFILWFGWYGFNAGSTFQVTDGAIFKAAKIAINTTLSGAAASVTGVPVGKHLQKYYDLGLVLNCTLAGLVSISAGCSSVTPLASICIGIFGALFYVAASETILHFNIDDPLDAFPIHGAAGLWGLLAVGIFDSDAKFEVQLLGAVVIAMWSTFFGFIIFKCCDKTIGLRVSSEIEAEGIDVHEHGGSAFTTDTVWSLDDVLSNRATRKALMKFMKAKYSEESLEFLLECRALFDALDMDDRIDYISEERDHVPAVTEVKKHVHDLITHVVETYIIVGSDKEMNIIGSLRKRYLMSFKGEHSDVSKPIVVEKIIQTLSQRIGFGVQVGPATEEFSTYITNEEIDVGNYDSAGNVDNGGNVGNATGISLSTKDIEKANMLTRAFSNTFEKSASSRSSARSKPTKKLSKEFLLAFIDAYKEIHRLVFQNFYFSFSHTDAFSKAKAKAESLKAGYV